MSSLFALPSIGGALTWATQLPSGSCTNEELRALGLTLSRMMIAATDMHDLAGACPLQDSFRPDARSEVAREVADDIARIVLRADDERRLAAHP